jgi:hypothetical protein
VSAGTEALLATVRKALPKIRDKRLVYTMTVSDVLKAHPSLDSLAAELERVGALATHHAVVAETEFQRAEGFVREAEAQQRRFFEELEQREAAEDELERVKAERDHLGKSAQDGWQAHADEEARLGKALAALRFYGERHRYHSECCGNCIANDGGYIARAAIVEIEGEATPLQKAYGGKVRTVDTTAAEIEGEA